MKVSAVAAGSRQAAVIDTRRTVADAGVSGPVGSRALRAVLIVLLALIPLLQIGVVATGDWLEADRPRDATAYWAAAERVRAGEPLYTGVEPGPNVPGVGAPYLYPPFLAAVLSFVAVDHAAFVRAMLVLGLLCYWFYAACLGRVATGRFSAFATLLWGAALMAGFGAQGAVSAGQIEPLIWALFGAALVFPAARGFALAAAGAAKLYALWPLGLALWRDRRRAAIGAAAAVGLACIAAVAALGARGTVTASMTWLTGVYPSLAQGQFAWGLPDGGAPGWAAYLGNGNLSLAFLPLQLAHFAGLLDGASLPVAARAYLTLAGIAAPAAALWLLRRRSIELRLAGVMAAAVLFGPIFRSTYSPILFAVAAAWAGERRGALAVPGAERAES